MTKKELLDQIEGYKITRHCQHGYEKYYLSLQFKNTFAAFGLDWQRNMTGALDPEPKGDYYACHVTTSLEDLDLLSSAAKLLQSLFDRDTLYNLQPGEAIGALVSAGVEEVQYHRGSGHYYTKQNWPTKASYKLMTGTTYEKHLFADSEQEAIAEGIKYAAANAHRASMQQWLKDQTVVFLASPEEWQEDRPLLKAS
jgi:hypothetical protein